MIFVRVFIYTGYSNQTFIQLNLYMYIYIYIVIPLRYIVYMDKVSPPYIKTNLFGNKPWHSECNV